MPILSPAEWFHYHRTKTPFRVWEFTAPYEPLHAIPGELLYEDAEEFRIRAKGGDPKTARDAEPWQVAPLLVETGDAPWEVAEKLYRRGVKIMERLAAWVHEENDVAPGICELATAILEEAKKNPPPRVVRWWGDVAGAVERELAAVGTEVPAQKEPRAWELKHFDHAHELYEQRHAVKRRIGHKCRDCGAYFPWTGTSAKTCPDCRELRAAAQAAKRAERHLCCLCGNEYRRRGRAKMCSACREKARNA